MQFENWLLTFKLKNHLLRCQNNFKYFIFAATTANMCKRGGAGTLLLPLELRVCEAAMLYKIKKGVPWSELSVKRIIQCKKWLYSKDIFTDGCKIDDKVGTALSIWKDQMETKLVKLCLSSYCTVYQAELLAICEVSRRVTKDSAESFGIGM